MKLSERGAIKAAIADGGFYLYPAGKLIDIIKQSLAGDELKRDFEPAALVQKISCVSGPSDPAAYEIFKKDMALLCQRLADMNPEYNIEPVFDKMLAATPALAKRYYGIDGFKAPRPKVVEYYFEGINDIYKDGDWTAFNIDPIESREMNVPIGIYFKRDQVTPGMPEHVSFHEANHAMQEACGMVGEVHHYIPWMDEGFADVFGKLMLFRATGNESLMRKVKNFKAEIASTDPRQVTYHYGEETAALILLKGRLPFLKALMRARGKDPFAIDWNLFANEIKAGWDPHIAIVTAFNGANKDAFRKRLERDEIKFRKEADLDQSDLKVLGMILASQAPACIPAAEYSAGLWLMDEVTKNPSAHFVDPYAIPEGSRKDVAGWKADEAIAYSSLSSEVLKKAPAVKIKTMIREDAIPNEIKAEVAKLAQFYFILKRQFGGISYFEPYGGGLPYRIGTGEVRCSY